MLGRIVLCSVPILTAAEKTQPPSENEAKKRLVCRPSELPMYPPPPSTVSKVEVKELSTLQKALLEPISAITSSFSSISQQAGGLTSQLSETVGDTTKQFKFVVTYLREEDNQAQRIGAMATGTLAGFIFGLRGGIFRRVFYSLIGAGAMGTICYPKEAQEYYQMAFTEGKLLANVAYNFAYGVKPGDPQPELSFPEINIPKSFPEFVDMAVNVGSSVKNMVMPPKKDGEKSE